MMHIIIIQQDYDHYMTKPTMTMV